MKNKSILDNSIVATLITILIGIALAILLINAFEKDSMKRHLETCRFLENRVESNTLSFEEYKSYGCIVELTK